MKKKPGRKGICDGKAAQRFSFQICPDTRKILDAFYMEHGLEKSIVINDAIRDYYARRKDELQLSVFL